VDTPLRFLGDVTTNIAYDFTEKSTFKSLHDMMLEGSPNLDDHPHHPESTVTSANGPWVRRRGRRLLPGHAAQALGLDDAESDICSAQRPIRVRMFDMSSLPGVSTRDLRQHCRGRRLPSSQDTEIPDG
jgi:hypothetical protein